jgi:hypothetical protein
MPVNITRRPTTPNPIATTTAMHITANEVDSTDETDNSEIRYYLSAEFADYDAARSVVFSKDFTWDDWIPPVEGLCTVHLRQDADDVSVAQLQFTVDAAA